MNWIRTLHLFPNRCFHSDYLLTVALTRCQDCGKSVCPERVAGLAFSGYSDPTGSTISRTRYVCAAHTEHGFLPADAGLMPLIEAERLVVGHA